MSGRKQTTRQASLENDKLRAEIAALRTQNTELQDAAEILKDAASKKKGLPKNSPMLLAIKGESSFCGVLPSLLRGRSRN